MSSETSLDASRADVVDPAVTPARDPFSAPQGLIPPVGGNAFGNPLSGEIRAFTPSEGVPFSRRVKRITETQEIQIRTTRRRRKIFTRSGVLAGFGLAMVVYPVLGNVVTYENSAQAVPGIIVGEAPTTGHAILGDGPALITSSLPLPSVADEAAYIASNTDFYVVNSLLPDCLPQDSYEGENGKIPLDQLCRLWGDRGVYLRADAALALAKLNEEFRIAFGRDLCISSGYRSYEDQVATKRKRGYMAATPGKSVHGWGLAFDLCSGDDEGAPKRWLDANAATFGFENPSWAKFRKFEPWHWEYMPGTQELGVYGSEYWESDDEAGTRTSTDVTTDPGTSTGAGTETQPANPAPTTPPPATETTPPAEPDASVNGANGGTTASG